MRVSTRGRYGLRAMLDIALFGAQHPVSLKQMSRRQNISTDYLEQLLRKLRGASLVKSVRGPRGGFRLSKAAEDIRIWDVVAAVEQEVAPVHCVDAVVGKRAPKKRCDFQRSCATHRLWTGLAKEIRSYLEARTLQDLVDDAKAMGDQFISDEQPMFYI